LCLLISCIWSQDFVITARTCISNSKTDDAWKVSAPSVDSIMDLEGLDCSQQSKLNFLYSAATANSTMDYLVKVIEDGMVDSPPSRNQIPLTVSSPSPLKVTLS
jgi:hypothetical protein